MSLHPTDIHPSPEQQRAREQFLKQEGLRIDAYAGTGKTTTLRLLASSTNGRGLYLAFNRSIAENARGKFPTQVACATSHSLAFRAIARSFGYPDWKLTGTLTPNTVVEAFRMPENLTFHSGLTLSKWSYCSVLLDAVKRFLLPQNLLRRFRLNRTTSEVVGAPSVAAAAIFDHDPTSEDPRLSGVVSPYHSPAKGESRDMASLRRIFG